MKTERVVLYLRVSKDNGIQDTERQLNDLTKKCHEKNYEIVKVYKDEISGKTDITQRKGLTELFNFVSDKTNLIDGVCITELSRLGRDLQSSIKLIDDFSKIKIFVYSQTNELNTLNPDKSENNSSRMTMDLMMVIAQNERKQLINRVLSGLSTKLKKDNSASGGMVLYGYFTKNKQMYIHEEESLVVKEVFNLYLSGMGTTLIANYLNEKNIPTRLNKTPTQKNKSGELEEKSINLKNGMNFKYNQFRWSDSTVYFMLTNTIYKGYRIYREKLNEGIIEHKVKQPQIIDTEIFDKVQEKLRSGYNKKDNSIKFNYIFDNGLIKCSVCGRSYFPHQRSNGKDSSFKCLSKRYNSKDCDNSGIGISKLYSGVWYFLRRLNELSDILIENRKNSTISKDIEKYELLISNLKNDFKIIENNENTIVRKLLDNSLSEVSYNTIYKELQINKEKIQTELNSIQSELNSLLEFEQKQLTLNEQIRELKNDPSKMKEIVKLLVKQIIIYPVKDKKFTMGVVKNDTMIYIELYLYTSTEPINFLLSRYSNLIQPLEKNEFDTETNLIVGNVRDIKKRIEPIKYKIESNVLL